MNTSVLCPGTDHRKGGAWARINRGQTRKRAAVLPFHHLSYTVDAEVRKPARWSLLVPTKLKNVDSVVLECVLHGCRDTLIAGFSPVEWKAQSVATPRSGSFYTTSFIRFFSVPVALIHIYLVPIWQLFHLPEAFCVSSRFFFFFFLLNL